MNSAKLYTYHIMSLSHLGGRICRWFMATGPELLSD